MKLLLQRVAERGAYTIGKLSIDGQYFCDTLEDRVRLKPGMSLSEMRRIKVQAETAIPAGKYQVVIDKSVRFGKRMPRLLHVPCFEGIRIHSGNTDKDTEGCILVGTNSEKGKVLCSRETFNKLMKILEPACVVDKVVIEIK